MERNLPDALDRELILEAIRDFDEGVPHRFGPSTTYDVLHEGKRYPPIAIVALAVRRLDGRELTPDDIRGGEGTKCFSLLRRAGFPPVPKDPNASSAPRSLEAVPLEHPRRHWAIVTNPRLYRAEDAIREHDDNVWTASRGDIREGDGVAIWRSRGQDGKRGVLALGVVLSGPDEIEAPEELAAYWIEPPAEKVTRRVWVRTTRPLRGPLWMDDSAGAILAGLSVSRATGGGVYQITEEQWSALETALGAAPSLEDDADEPDDAPELPPLSSVRVTRSPTPLLRPVAERAPSGANDTSERITSSTYRRSKQSLVAGNRAEEIVRDHLRASLPPACAATIDTPGLRGEKRGWDIEYRDEAGERVIIEVKGTKLPAFPGSVDLTANEWRAAETYRDRFHLYLVASCLSSSPVIQSIEDPYGEWHDGKARLTPLVWRFESARTE
jgi:hypothetical protein